MTEYFTLEEDTRGLFGLPPVYDGHSWQRDVLCNWEPRLRRAFARYQWHHIVSMYVHICSSSGSPPARICIVDDDMVVAKARKTRKLSQSPIPIVVVHEDQPEYDSCCHVKAHSHDPLYIGGLPHQFGPLLQWYTNTVLPVVIGHLRDPPRLLHAPGLVITRRTGWQPLRATKKAPKLGKSKRRVPPKSKHRVIRRRHTVIRRCQGTSPPPMPKR